MRPIVRSVLRWQMALGVSAVLGVGCASNGKRDEFDTDRMPAAGEVEFGTLLGSTKSEIFYGNLHAHHFMGANASRKPTEEEIAQAGGRAPKKIRIPLSEVLKPGDCRMSGAQFPEDDGRPCRDDQGLTNQTIPLRTPFDENAPDVTDYFKQACEYGTTEGKLDVLFVTPHTKNNQTGEQSIDTSSKDVNLHAREVLLPEMNGGPRAGKFYCGMGQEASSISAGNHMNIFGQFSVKSSDGKPFFFPTGKFGDVYPEIGKRRAAGERILVQMNHPDVEGDLWLGDLSRLFATDDLDKKAKDAAKKLKKSKLNDYGLDDFAPMGCILKNLPAEECANVTDTESTLPNIRATYATIRQVSGDPFRLIEVIPPNLGRKPEGEGDSESVGVSKEESFGATSNTRTTFRKVQKRADANSYETGIRNWIFYLSMGFKLAPTANQDNHFMNYGSATASRTGILARDLSEDGVLSALDARRTFASEDMNAKTILRLRGTSPKGSPVRATMGDSVTVTGKQAILQVGYQDADAEDQDAELRIYYYRENDVLDFGYQSAIEAPFRTVEFTIPDQGLPRAILPDPNAKSRSANDLLPIRSGQVVGIRLPVEAGNQWVFVEIVQKGDHDKIWSAPIWIGKP